MSAWLWQCSRCREAFLLLVRIGGRDLCAECWRALGSPFPVPAPPNHDAERTVHDRMLKRGGEDRYRVLAGKA